MSQTPGAVRARATALLLALGALATAAGAALSQPPVPAPTATAAPAPGSNEKQVMVTLEYDPKKPGVPVGIKTPYPDPVELSKGKGHKAHWYLSPPEAGTLKIEMKAADPKPFKSNPRNNGKDSVSEIPDRGVAGQSYPYTITVHVDGLSKDLVLDPVIKITP